MKLKTKGKLKTLTMAFLFLVLIFVGKCHGQARQFRVERICPMRLPCKSYQSALIAVVDSVVFVRSDTTVKYNIVKHFFHKGIEYFNVKNENSKGIIVLTTSYAVIDVYHPESIRRYEIYHLKPDL